MKDWKHKGLCYNYDEKYVKENHCQGKKFFHIDVNSTPKIEDMG